MNYNHLSIDERACITKFKEMKLSIREMSKLLNRSPSTISRELKRNSYRTGINYYVLRYVPTDAHKKYKERRKSCRRHLKIDSNIKTYIEDKLK